MNALCLDTLTTLGVIGGWSLLRWRNYKMGYPLCLACFFLMMPHCFLLSIKLMLCPTRVPIVRHSLVCNHF